jgi:signal transduction histidine kinase
VTVRAERSRGRPRIRRRMALMAAVVTGAVVLAFCIPLSLFVRSVAYDRAVDGAEVQARSLAAELVTVADRATIERLARQANGAASQTPATVYLASGQAIGPRSSLVPVPAAVRAGRQTTIAGPQGAREIWEPVRGPSASLAVRVSIPQALLSKGVTREWILLFGGGFVLVLIAVALADRMGRTIVRPISELEDVTHQLRDGDMERRVVPAGPYEVAEVGHAVNELADRIDSLLVRARMVGADLGHRLRTPLTALRLDVESLDDQVGAAVMKDLDALEESVSRLIQETRQPPKRTGHSDLAAAVRGRMAFWGVLAKSQGRPFTFDEPSRHVEVALDRDEIEAAIDALLSNIFTHSAEGTGFHVTLRPAPSPPSSWMLVVEDEGIPPVSPTATARPHRGAGTGLGLDIVRRSAERAGGTATIGRSRQGGFLVELLLPEWTGPAEPNRPDYSVSTGPG